MNQVLPNPEARAKKESYLPEGEEIVFRMDPRVVNVGPGETFNIVLDCKSGFKVYVPYPEFFDKVETEAKVVDPQEIGATPDEQWWRASLTRKPGNNNHPTIRQMAYCVYSKDLDNFAVGDSPPKMTLEP